MTVSKYDLVETFEVTRVHPERDSITDLIRAAEEYRRDGGHTWTVEGMCVVFKLPMSSTLTPMAEEA